MSDEKELNSPMDAIEQNVLIFGTTRAKGIAKQLTALNQTLAKYWEQEDSQASND